MTKESLNKRIGTGLLAGLFSVALLTGCGGDEVTSSGASGSSGSGVPKAEIPARAEVRTSPTATFIFGEHEAKVYELTGVEFKKFVNPSSKIVTMGDAIFFSNFPNSNEDKKPHICKVTMKGETLADLQVLTPSGNVRALATNGKVVLWPGGGTNKIMTYDGTEPKEGAGKWGGDLAGVPGSDEFYEIYGSNGKVKLNKLENGEFKDAKTLVESLAETKPEYAKGAFQAVCADKNEVYVTISGKDDKGQNFCNLIVLDNSGKELRHFEGQAGEWVVMNNYIAHFSGDNRVKIFDRQIGDPIGEAPLEIGQADANGRLKSSGKKAWTIKGNDVLIFDAANEKFYRIDF